MENRLTELAVKDARWYESATGQLANNWQLSSEVEILSQDLIDSVVAGNVSVQELRGGVAWASALDREAVDVYGADIAEGNQQIERLARRTMHLVGRAALEAVKNSRKRTLARVAHANKLKI